MRRQRSISSVGAREAVPLPRWLAPHHSHREGPPSGVEQAHDPQHARGIEAPQFSDQEADQPSSWLRREIAPEALALVAFPRA